MRRLSRGDIEAIAERVITVYCKLPEVSGKPLRKVNPGLLLESLLKLNIGYEHLSRDGQILGLTTFQEMGVEVYDDADSEFMYILDGKTILVEKDLKYDVTQTGRCNFSLMHEGAHQILKMLFPNDYGIPSSEKSPIHCYKVNSEKKKPITDWEEWQANTLASAILLPKEVVKYGMYLFGLGNKIEILNKISRPAEYERFSYLSEFLGVSKQALAIRMKYLGLLDKDYLDNPFDIIDVVWEA